MSFPEIPTKLETQIDDNLIARWFNNSEQQQAGGFVTALHHCYAVADQDNRRILRPAVQEIMMKYPEYFKSIQERTRESNDPNRRISNR